MRNTNIEDKGEEAESDWPEWDDVCQCMMMYNDKSAPWLLHHMSVWFLPRDKLLLIIFWLILYSSLSQISQKQQTADLHAHIVSNCGILWNIVLLHLLSRCQSLTEEMYCIISKYYLCSDPLNVVLEIFFFHHIAKVK